MDYETLKVIWWGLVLFLLVGFVVMDGFDLGVGMLLPVVGKTDDERRVLLNSVGPVWEGNQVWLIAGAGTLFAAWPWSMPPPSRHFTCPSCSCCSVSFAPGGF